MRATTQGRLPTGSFKARGLALGVSIAKELGVTNIAMPTNGNAGSALAAYGTRVGIRTTVLCPDNTPKVNVEEIAMQGAGTYRVNGAICLSCFSPLTGCFYALSST